VTVRTGTDSTFGDDREIELVLGGSAIRGRDYTIGDTRLTLGAGSDWVRTTVTGLPDDVFEGDETVTVSALLDGIGFGAQQTLTLTDGDTAPAVTLTLTPEAITENGGESEVTATLVAPSEIAFDVTVSAEAVAPAVADDFNLAGATLSFTANATESTGTVLLTAVDNPVDAPDKQVRINGTVSDPRFAAPEAALLTLQDDDEASNSVTVTVEPAAVSEAARPTELTVTATFDAGARRTPAEFDISVLGGGGTSGAVANVDFNAVSDFYLTIPADFTSGSATFTLTPRQDRIREGTETLVLSTAPRDLDIGVTETPAILLTDDDATPEPELTVSVDSLVEGGDTAEVIIGTGFGTTFESATTITLTLAGTATPESDYTIDATSLVLPAGIGTAPSSVSTVVGALNDAVYEPLETIEVSALRGDDVIGTATVTIEDANEPPELVLSVNPETILENGGVANVTVSTGDGATFPEARTVSLSLAGTATAGEDYTVSPVRLILPAGNGFEPASVSAELTAVEDEQAESEETVIVTGTLDGIPFGEAVTVRIADSNGAPRVLLLLSAPSVSENGGVVTVRGMVSPPVAEPFTVAISVAAVDPALAGGYVLSDTVLRFEAGATESTREVTLTAVDNDRHEGDRSFTISGAASLDGVTSPPGVAITIVDNDGEEAPPGASPDVNQDGVVDGDDALVMYYAYTLADLVGDGHTGGVRRFRRILLAGRAAGPNPTDAELMRIIRNANALRQEVP